MSCESYTTRLTVNPFHEEDGLAPIDMSGYLIQIERTDTPAPQGGRSPERPRNQWAVRLRGDCYALNSRGKLVSEYEPLPSSRTQAFLKRYRMDLEQAHLVADALAVEIRKEVLARMQAWKEAQP